MLNQCRASLVKCLAQGYCTVRLEPVNPQSQVEHSTAEPLRSSYSVNLLSAAVMICALTLCLLGNFVCFFLSSADFFQNQLLEKFFQEYHQSIKEFGPRSGPTFCLA